MRSEAVKLEREKRKTAAAERAWEREKLLYDRLLTPNVVRLLLMLGCIAYSTHVTRSEHKESPVASALAFAATGIGVPMLAADAGITDKYALAAISAAGTAYTGLSALEGLRHAGALKVDWSDLALRSLPGGSVTGELIEALQERM